MSRKIEELIADIFKKAKKEAPSQRKAGLCNYISKSLDDTVSVEQLKRYYDYYISTDKTKPLNITLSISDLLSSFLGYKDYESYTNKNSTKKTEDLSEKLLTQDQIFKLSTSEKEEHIELLKPLTFEGPNSVNVLLQLGLLLFLVKRYSEALSKFKSVLDTDPFNLEIHYFSCLSMFKGKIPSGLTEKEIDQIIDDIPEKLIFKKQHTAFYRLIYLINEDFYNGKSRLELSKKDVIKVREHKISKDDFYYLKIAFGLSDYGLVRFLKEYGIL